MNDGPIFTPKEPNDILAHTEILVLRQMSDSLRTLGSDVKDVRERVIRIESEGAMQRISGLESKFDKIAERVNSLESDKDKRTGMTDLSGWFIKNTPWLVTLAVGAAAFVLKGHI